MSNNISKEQQIRDLKGKISDTELRKKIGEVYGVAKTQRQAIFNKLFPNGYKLDVENGIIKGIVKNKKTSFKPHGDKAIAESKDNTIRSVEDLVRICNIDLNEWQCVKFTANSYADKFQAKGEFAKKKDENSIKLMLEGFLEDTKKFAPSKFIFEKPKSTGKLYILNLQDPHFGKLCSNSETSHGNYDLKIAKQVYSEAVDDLLLKAPKEKIETVLLVLGSDLLHFDTESVTTTQGTRLDSDSRWSKVYNEACDTIAQIVEKLASKFKVEIMGIYGNHARVSEYALGSYIKAFFRNHPNVNVNNEPKDRKYFGFKKSLIGFSHGEDVKATDLPLILMRENQSTVSNYEQFFFLTGHTHQDKLVEVKGVRVMVCPALCPPDKYHSSHGYIGNVQTSQGLLFDDFGLEAVIYSKSPDKIV